MSCLLPVFPHFNSHHVWDRPFSLLEVKEEICLWDSLRALTHVAWLWWILGGDILLNCFASMMIWFVELLFCLGSWFHRLRYGGFIDGIMNVCKCWYFILMSFTCVWLICVSSSQLDSDQVELISLFKVLFFIYLSFVHIYCTFIFVFYLTPHLLVRALCDSSVGKYKLWMNKTGYRVYHPINKTKPSCNRVCRT